MLIILLAGGILYALNSATNLEGDLNFTTPNSNIKLYANDGMDVFSEGQSIELYGLTGTAKPYIGWYSYDPASKNYRGVGWLGCHYNLSNGNIHQHCSIETLENVTGIPTLNTKFEISYGSNLTKNDPALYAKFSSLSKLILGEGVDLKLTGSASDIEGSSELDLYPDNQKEKGLRIKKDSNGIIMQVLGGDTLTLNEGDIFYTKNIRTQNLNTNQFKISNLPNQGMDRCKLNSGTCTILNTKVTINTSIFCITQSGSENLGSLHITSRTPGINYTVTSTNKLANQEVACILIDPS